MQIPITLNSIWSILIPIPHQIYQFQFQIYQFQFHLFYLYMIIPNSRKIRRSNKYYITNHNIPFNTICVIVCHDCLQWRPEQKVKTKTVLASVSHVAGKINLLAESLNTVTIEDGLYLRNPLTVHRSIHRAPGTSCTWKLLPRHCYPDEKGMINQNIQRHRAGYKGHILRRQQYNTIPEQVGLKSKFLITQWNMIYNQYKTAYRK